MNERYYIRWKASSDSLRIKTCSYRQGDIAVISPFTPHSNISPAGFCNIQKTSVDEIAMMCGFREGLYFSRMFRKKYGVPPGKYRKMMNESNESRITPDTSKIMLQ